MANVRWEHYPHVGGNEVARAWLVLESNLGLAANTLDAYGRGLEEYIAFSAGKDTAVVTATRDHIAAYIRYLTTRPSRRAPNAVDSTPAQVSPMRLCSKGLRLFVFSTTI